MSKSQLTEQFVQPLIVGAIGWAGAYALGEGNKIASVGGMSISLPLFLGLTTGVSSAFGETLKQWVLPMLPNNSSYVSIENTFLSPVLVGGVNAVAIQFLTKTRLTEAFLLGAGSEILGTYLYDGVLKPYTMNTKY